ncbi:hypothetical protein [Streptomyces sp. uw30]|uniref:hypothetical protein n=1 Tax=Streptomyces sp. uw30 TaxID=1828179 RepID=UPI0011CED0B6|nr:hypothetical protein [Streptomyces sp. uw30]
MAQVKGSHLDGWTIKFTTKETLDIADATNMTGVAAGFIPDPTLSKIVAACLTLSGILLRRAVRDGYKLKVKVKPHSIPSRWPPSAEELLDFMTGPLKPRVKPSLY